MSINREPHQVTCYGPGFTADAFIGSPDRTWGKAFKGKAAAEKWLARETAKADAEPLADRPLIEQHLALVSENGTEKSRPVWFGGFTASREA